MSEDHRAGFARRLLPYAKQLESQTGIPSNYTLAMAANETGWNDTNPVMFGLRGKSPSGQSTQRSQWHVDPVGGPVPVIEEFASYTSPEEAFQHLGSQLNTLPAIDKSSARSFAASLRQGGWTDDPNYDEKIQTIADQIGALDLEMGPKPIKPPPGPLQDELAKLEAESVNVIQGRSYLSEAYRNTTTRLVQDTVTAERAVREVEQQLTALRQPDSADFLASLATSAAETIQQHEPTFNLTPRYSQAKTQQIAMAASTLDMASKHRSKLAFMQSFLEVAPVGWRTGDFPEDLQGAINTFLDQSMPKVIANPEQYKQEFLQGLTPDDINLLGQAWSELPHTVQRIMSDEEVRKNLDLLSRPDKPKPVLASQLTLEEIQRSLTETRTKRLPESVDQKAFLEGLSKFYGDPDTVKDLASSRERWRTLAQQWFIQNEATKIRRAGLISPEVQNVSGWEWVSLAAEQPFLLPMEALEAYNRNVPAPILGYSFGSGAGPVATAGGGALLGAAIGAPIGGVGAIPGAAVGGLLGLGYGLYLQANYGGEIATRWAETQRKDPSLSAWQAAGLAWREAETGGVNQFVAETLADPSNIFGTGLVTKIVKPIPVLGKWFGAAERGFSKFADVSAWPLATGIIGTAIAGNPIVFPLAAAAPLLTRRLNIPFTFDQLARRSAADAAATWHQLAMAEAARSTGPRAILMGQARSNDFLQVADRAMATLRKDPRPAVWTELHRLGYQIWQTGFKPISVIEGPDHANLTKLTKAFGVELDPSTANRVAHNLTDAMYSNIGKGTFYDRKEQVARVAAAIGVDLGKVFDTGPGKRSTAAKLINKWVNDFEKQTWREATSSFTQMVDGRRNPSPNPTKAIENFRNQHYKNQVDLYRHPGYQIQHAEGIAGNLQRFVDSTARTAIATHLTNFTQGIARQTLLFVNYGPTNVIENAYRMIIGGVNPFPGTHLGAGTWSSTGLDTIHLLASAYPEDNLRPFIRGVSDHFAQNAPPMAAVPNTPGQVLEGLKTSGGVIPGITQPIPETLRTISRLAGGKLEAPAAFIEAHIPEKFWSMQNWNKSWQSVTDKQQAFYIYQKWLQGLGERDPDTVKALLGAVGDIKAVPGLADTLPADLLGSIQQKVNTYALMAEPEVVRSLKMTTAELVNTQLTNRMAKALQKYPELGEIHTRAILNGIKSGELGLRSNPTDTARSARDFLERVMLSWWDQSVPGKLEFQSRMMDDIQQQLLSFHPDSPDEMARLMGMMHDMMDTASESASKAMESTVLRGDELSHQERVKLFGFTYSSLNSLITKMDDTYQTVAGRLVTQITASDMTDRQKQLMLSWIGNQMKDLRAIQGARAAEDARHQRVFQGQLDPEERSRAYVEERAKVRQAWDVYQRQHAGIIADTIELQKELAQSFGVTIQAGAIRPPTAGTLTPADVGYLYNKMPAAILKDLVDPVNLTLMSKDTFTTRHLTRAERLAKGMGKAAEDFGFTTDSIGEVYDNLLRSASLEPSGATVDTASRSWFKQIQDDLIGHMQVSHLQPGLADSLNKWIDTAADNIGSLRTGQLPGGVAGPVQTIDMDKWSATRRASMDGANLEYAKDFPDYSNQHLFDAVMKGFFPFWMYEKERFPWLIRSVIKRPFTGLLWSKYMEHSDDGYFNLPIPGQGDIQVNPLRGTVYMGGFRRLMMRDTPEYQDQFPSAVTGLLDRAGRVGFYPGIHISAPLAIFGGTTPQTQELLPNYANTFLGAINQLPIPDNARRTINEHIFPDRYRTFRTIQTATEMGQDGAEIWNKISSNTPLTDQERQTWNRAEQRVWLVSGTLDAQFGLFRLRGKQKAEVFEAMKDVKSALLGVPREQIDRITKLQSQTGKRLSDIYPMDPLHQWLEHEYFSKYESFLRPQTTPLLPSALGEQQQRINSYYQEVDKVWQKAREEGFYEKDNDGNQRLAAKSLKQLDQEFRNGQLNARDYQSQSADTMERATTAAATIGNTGYYSGVPKTRSEREKFYVDHGVIQPTFSPGQELLWEYYQLRPQMKPDETGTNRADWETYFQQVDTLIEAMNPEVQQRFLARTQADWTPTQRLYYQHSKTYLAAYRNIRTAVLQEMPPADRQLAERYNRADPGERDRIQNQQDANGKKILTAANSSITAVRQSLREANPEMDAVLLFWGKTDKVLTPEAEKIYNQLLQKHRPGGTVLDQYSPTNPVRR